jgi:hypothetical protein
MTAHYKDTRHYAAPRALIFQACIDVIQPSGLLLTASDPQTGTIAATSSDGPFSYGPDSGLLEEIGLFFVAGRNARSKFRERILIEVDAHSDVHVLSISEPSFMMGDQGRNRNHVITLWKALDEILVRPHGVSVNLMNDNSVTISGNIGPVQNASPHAQQQAAGPGAHQQMGQDIENLDQVLSFLAEVEARVDQLELEEAEAAELQAIWVSGTLTSADSNACVANHGSRKFRLRGVRVLR